MNIDWKPQILWAMTLIAMLAMVVTFIAPEHIVQIVGSAITGVGMLGMKLLEK